MQVELDGTKHYLVSGPHGEIKELTDDEYRRYMASEGLLNALRAAAVHLVDYGKIELGTPQSSAIVKALNLAGTNLNGDLVKKVVA